jgi:hypothetical protein
LYTSCVLGLRPSVLFNEFLLIKKKNIWRFKSPTRVAFFVWSAALGKILTHDNLRKMNVIVMEWCCLCKKSGESIDHLLLHWKIARDLWSYILILLGVEWVMPRMVLELLNS